MDRLLDLCVDLVLAAPDPGTAEQRHRASARMLLDALGCAFGAYSDDVPRVVRAVAARRLQPDGARVLGTGDRVSPEMACFANGVMVRYLDFNDAYGSTVGVGHPSDYIPAVLAAGEMAGADGVAVLEAIALTYEIFCRLTDVTKLGVERWDHVVNGAVASAAGAARIRGLSRSQVRHALSLALVPNVALQVTRLNGVSMWKGCASANAARNGLFAAELAEAGISGPDQPFRGRGGLFSAIASSPDIDAWDRPRDAILDCNIKRYPAGYFAQGAVQAALELREAGIASEHVVAVKVGTFAFGVKVMAGDREKWRPTTRETADHSLPYVVARALAYGKLDRDSFDEAGLLDPTTLRLLNMLTVEIDDACEEAWPAACMNTVSVLLDNGIRHSRRIRHYRGHSANPLNQDELVTKFRMMAQPVLGVAATQRLAAAVAALPTSTDLNAVLDAATLAGSPS